MKPAFLPSTRLPVGAGAVLAVLCAAVAHAATWSPLAPAAHPRSEGSLVVHDGGVLHFNGFDADLEIQNSVERYDLAADSWQTVAETSDSPGLQTALTHNGVVVVDGEVWLIGGRVGANPGRVTDRVVVLDLASYSWRDGPTLPVTFGGGGAALLGRRIHAFGGFDGDAKCDVTTHLVYDLDDPGAGWQDLSGSAPFPNPRNHFGTVVMDGRIYVTGGQQGHDGSCPTIPQSRAQTKFVNVYDPDTNAWTRLADLPWAESHTEPSSFAHAGRVWSVGGQQEGERVLTYDPSTDTWDWRKDLTLPRQLLAPGARIFDGNRLHVFGGGAPDVFGPRTETLVMEVPGLDSDTSGDTGSSGGDGGGDGGTDGGTDGGDGGDGGIEAGDTGGADGGGNGDDDGGDGSGNGGDTGDGGNGDTGGAESGDGGGGADDDGNGDTGGAESGDGDGGDDSGTPDPVSPPETDAPTDGEGGSTDGGSPAPDEGGGAADPDGGEQNGGGSGDTDGMEPGSSETPDVPDVDDAEEPVDAGNRGRSGGGAVAWMLALLALPLGARVRTGRRSGRDGQA